MNLSLSSTYKEGKIVRPERALVNTGHIYKFFKPTSLELAREVIAATGASWSRTIPERDYRAMTYLFALQKIAERVQELQHGGCIFIIPEGESARNVSLKYQCADKTVWACLRGKLILHDQYFGAGSTCPDGANLQTEMQDVEHGLRDSLDMVARLTAVDGALVVNRKLEVLGFGAVVKLGQKVSYKVYRCEDRKASQKRPVAIQQYGTRHRSAFEFCFRNQPSVAIVVSQDGGVKVVSRVGRDVCYWENALFDVATEI